MPLRHGVCVSLCERPDDCLVCVLVSVGIAVALACGSPPQQSIRIALVEEINKRNVEERGSSLCAVVELAVG